MTERKKAPAPGATTIATSTTTILAASTALPPEERASTPQSHVTAASSGRRRGGGGRTRRAYYCVPSVFVAVIVVVASAFSAANTMLPFGVVRAAAATSRTTTATTRSTAASAAAVVAAGRRERSISTAVVAPSSSSTRSSSFLVARSAPRPSTVNPRRRHGGALSFAGGESVGGDGAGLGVRKGPRWSRWSSSLSSSSEEDEFPTGGLEANDPLSSARAAAAKAAASSSFDPNDSSFGPDGVPDFGGSVGAARGRGKRFESRPTDYEYSSAAEEDERGGGYEEGGGAKKKDLRRLWREQQERDGRRGPPPSSAGRRRSRAKTKGDEYEGGGEEEGRDESSGKSFKDDFQGTRVFVQGIPDHVDWRQLKDHFGVAGSVVYASVSVDKYTGISKGCGVVQFETTAEARNAIKIMRDHPLDGGKLFVREDVQEKRTGGRDVKGGRNRNAGGEGLGGQFERYERGRRPPEVWKCADEVRASSSLSDRDRTVVLSLVEARDAARRRREYELSDALRDQLKDDHDVHVDDRLKLWWISEDGGVPEVVREMKGEGRWGKANAWRRIPTTPEMDALVDADRVEYLLKARDEARRTKRFDRADALLEEARDSPDGDVRIKVHDESRTWRIWTVEAPPPPPGMEPRKSQEELKADAAREALDLVREKSPDKLEEVETLLAKFPGREFNILRKLRQRFSEEE